LDRETSASFRHLLLRMYTYYRDASAAKFLAPKLTGKELQTLKTSSATPGHDQDQDASIKVKCGRCGRKDMHAEGKPLCTVPSELSDGQAKQLVRSLNHRQALKAVKAAKDLINEDHDRDIAEVISTARERAKE
jgi:hypothetical protein